MDQEMLYAMCPCGSGKKFKFCCYAKYRDEFARDMTRAEIINIVNGHAAGVYDIERENPEATRYYDRGYEALMDADLERARELLKKARTLHPRLFMAWNNEGSVAWNQGDFKAAYDIQKAGNEQAPILNVWGLAALAQYARALGKDEEAGALLERAVSEKPLNLFVAEQVCHTLAIDRRHRDILDYISRSQMAEDPRLRFFAAVALCNLNETDAALPMMRAARDSPYGKMAKFYVECLEAGVPPLSVYQDDWPYFDLSDFPPARSLEDAIADKKRNPLAVCGGLAIEALEILVSDNVRTAKELLPLVRGHEDDPRWVELIDGLHWVADDDEKVESGELPSRNPNGLPPGVTSVRDTEAAFPRCYKWRLSIEISEDSTAEAIADRVLNGLLRPYAERHCGEERGDCEIALLVSSFDECRRDSLECPTVTLGRFDQLWDIFRTSLVDFFEAFGYDAVNLTVSHDMMYGGPVLKVEEADDDLVTVFSIALPDRYK